MTTVKAEAKYVKGTPRKLRMVAASVKGMTALYAMDVLKYMRKGGAPKVRKVLQSAIANAVNNNNLDARNLVISKILVNAAPMLKRGRAESKGRYRQILKRNSHIVCFLTDQATGAIKKVAETAKAAVPKSTKNKKIKEK